MSDADMVPARFVPQKALPRSFIVAVALIVLAFVGTTDALEIDPQTVVADLLTALAAAAALALVLERAVEVLLSIICGPQEIASEAAHAAQKEAQEVSLKNEQAILGALETPEERITFLTDGGSSNRMGAMDKATTKAIHDRSSAKARQRITKQYLSTVILTALGGALAAGGFRILAQVFGAPDVDLPQPMVYLDILVTTLVLGGGAQGIHDMISSLSDET